MNFTPALVLAEEPLELKGELSAAVLDLHDPAIQASEPIFAELQVTRDEENLVAQGWLRTNLLLQCGRCIEWMPWPVRTEFIHFFAAPHPNSIDLTPLIREDILLELPLNAVCRLGADGRCPVTGQIYQPRPESSGTLASETVWEALKQIKLKD